MGIVFFDQFLVVEFPFAPDIPDPPRAVLSAKNRGDCPIEILRALAPVITGPVIVAKPRTVWVSPGHPFEMPTTGTIQASSQNSSWAFAEDFGVSMGIPFVSDEMKDLLEGGVKLTVPWVGLGPELALPVMKIVLHEELEIKTVQASLVFGHEQKGISFDHGGENLGVIGFAVLVIVEVLGQNDGGMLEFIRRGPGGA